jgi:simple sugar transport system ATP-binding protein/ribose transport system ATP-binding protein
MVGGDRVHLDVQGLGKSFGATRALDGVSVAIRAGSVHAFVGENGAGKSTLGKIVAGVFPQDQGELVLWGTPATFRSPREALERGIALVAQEVALVPRATVAENIFLGAEPRRAGFIDRRRMREQFERLAVDAGFDLQADARVGRLPLSKQQQVEILRALARAAELIILDEPTASLSAAEAERLHRVVRDLATAGRTVVLVSHFLQEVLELADTITILRDGRVVRTGPASDETEASLIAGMLGRSVGRTYPPKRIPAADAPVALHVESLQAPGVRGASVDVRAGEIVALAGLIGAGRSELGRAIYGATRPTAGEVRRGERTLTGTPSASIRDGVAIIPESRKDDGLMLRRPVRENVSLANLAAMSRLGFLRRGEERRRVGRALERVSAASRLDVPAVALSGGNQQKLMFARAIMTTPEVLIADEPTRGVDVGAKRDLYELLVDLAADGMAVLLISNEMEEILGLAHRVYVMRAGAVVAELADDRLTEEAILGAAFGTAPAA